MKKNYIQYIVGIIAILIASSGITFVALQFFVGDKKSEAPVRQVVSQTQEQADTYTKQADEAFLASKYDEAISLHQKAQTIYTELELDPQAGAAADSIASIEAFKAKATLQTPSEEKRLDPVSQP